MIYIFAVDNQTYVLGQNKEIELGRYEGFDPNGYG